MILIADSGSTKTDWLLLTDEPAAAAPTVKTQGINPVHQAPEAIAAILRDELLPQLPPSLAAAALSVCFYGSGCTPEKCPDVAGLLTASLMPLVGRLEAVEVESDLLGAARALCGRSEGIACILGTGSNSCLYDGTAIRQNTPALGYILGDEGSGAVLGRRFLNALFKGLLPEELRLQFLEETGLTLPSIINKVYREPLANRFLASLSPFIHRHLDCDALSQLVVDGLRDFFRHNIVSYRRPDLYVHFVGSIAACYEPQLRQAAAAEGLRVGRVLRSPLDGLAEYHR